MTSMESSSMKAVENAGKTEMEAGRKTNAERDGMEITTLERFGNLVERFVDSEPSDPAFPAIIIDFTKLLAELCDTFSEFKEEELRKYYSIMANMSSKYKYNPELTQQMTDWCKSRIGLIKIAGIAADEMDQNIQLVYKSQMLSSTVNMLSLLNLCIYKELSSCISSYVSGISSTFGIIMECALPLLPYLKYMGLTSSLFENLRSEVLIHHVLKAMQEDKVKFAPLKKWFDETKELEDSVKQLFPHEIDKTIVENIENYLKDLKEEQKIFATAVLSMTKKDPSLCRNRKLLSKVVLFCKSGAAKEWYKRMVTCARPLNLEISMIHFCNELQQLEEIDATAGLAIEIGNHVLPIGSVLPRLLLFGMHGMSVYSCYKKIKAGSKHKYSIGLRALVKNAEPILHAMENVHRRLLSVAN